MSVKRKTLWRWALVIAALLVVLPAWPAYAVVPAVVGPIQALVAILPQLMALLGAAAVAMLKPQTYKSFFKYIWTHPLMTLCVVACFAGAVWGLRELFKAPVGKARAGAAWIAFRGGPARSGSVYGHAGPMIAGKVAWREAENDVESADSSAAAVGNRLYYGASIQGVFGKSGAVYCRDAEKGGLVWKFTGKGQPKMQWHAGSDKGESRPLQPIFSSPALGAPFSEKVPKTKEGKPQEGRYLVIGEGYHLDPDCRVTCLDLEAVKLGKAKAPAFNWVRQTDSHVESSPCIFDGKAFIGAGDDGIWCIELASGKVLWRLEGCPEYYVAAGEKAGELEKLVGKTVTVTGTVARSGVTLTDPGKVLMTVKTVKEGAEPTLAYEGLGEGFERKVSGVVAILGDDPKVYENMLLVPLKGASRVCIKPDPEKVFPDVESSPVALEVEVPKDPAKPEGEKLKSKRVYIGCGVGGQKVLCIDAETGKIIWKRPTPYPAFGSPAVVDGKVLIGLGNGTFVESDPNPRGTILCLSAADGGDIWTIDYENDKVGDAFLGALATCGDRAYGCCRDGNLYIVDIEEGKLLKRFDARGPMVCSPAATEGAVYITTDRGKMICVDTERFVERWSKNLTAGEQIFSSPVVTDGRIYVGSLKQGLFCLVEDPAGASRKARPWGGPGGGAARAGAADRRGLPAVPGQQARRKWLDYPLKDRTLPTPLAACGGSLYLMVREAAGEAGRPLLARVDDVEGKELWHADLRAVASALCVTAKRVWALAGDSAREQSLICLDARTGGELWRTPAVYLAGMLSLRGDRMVLAPRTGGLVCLRAEDGAELWKSAIGESSGAPAMSQGLALAAVGGDEPRLVCLEDGGGRQLWSKALPAAPVGAVALSAGRVLVACKGAEDVKGALICCHLTDGGRLWKAKLPVEPAGYPAADDEYAAVLGADEKVYAFDAESGKAIRDAGVPCGRGAQPPALVSGVVVFAGRNRLGPWSLSANSWPWRFRDAGLMGNVLAPPVVMNETIYVVTEKRGLMAVGEHEVVALLTGLKWPKVSRENAWLLAREFPAARALKAADLKDLKKVLSKEPLLAEGIFRELHPEKYPQKKEAAK